jgi:hypothetical protein
MPQPGEHGKHIAGCASWICLKQRVALTTDTVLRKIDQKLPQCYYIVFLHAIPSIIKSTKNKKYKKLLTLAQSQLFLIVREIVP